MKPAVSHYQEEEGLPALRSEEWIEMLVESKASTVFKSSQTLIARSLLISIKSLNFQKAAFPQASIYTVHIYWQIHFFSHT